MEFYTETFGNATCDQPAALKNFDGAAYMGTWYEQQHVMGQFFQPDDSTCVQAQYTNLQADGHFTVSNTLQDVNFGARTGVVGTGYCPDATGHCFVKFYGPMPKNSNYKVVDTDYKTYSIVYSCGITKSFLWLLTREPVVSDTLYNQMVATAKKNLPNFDFSRMDARDYQGPKCSYAKSSFADAFLQ